MNPSHWYRMQGDGDGIDLLILYLLGEAREMARNTKEHTKGLWGAFGAVGPTDMVEGRPSPSIPFNPPRQF